MDSRFIRKSFLDFFKERGHVIVPSSSLVPQKDPTLLFTSAGMVQFKPYWSGEIDPPYRRAASVQKCLRVTDLEEVGKTIKHNTFFEMLGNFSFGDYFKKEALKWAWEYVTQVLGLPAERLWVSVFYEDEEAYKIWRDEIGVDEKRITKLGEEDNFWGPAGGTGACGPSSEIFYDMGEEFFCKEPEKGPASEGERFVEIWNIVFPQFDQQPDGKRLPLKNRGIDTGMGLERTTMVLENKKSIFETELFAPIVEHLADKMGIEIKDDTRIPLYIAADHVRALTFAITDGVVPSNEERGYVLRKILRRALRELKKIGVNKPVLYLAAGVVVEIMHPFYPELEEKREVVSLIIRSEEERFLKTLDAGIFLFKKMVSSYKEKKRIPGKEVFKLYDTYGFPFELTKEMAEEEGFEIDFEEFEEEMKRQRTLSKKSSQFMKPGDWIVLKEGVGEFVGYEKDEIETEILRYRIEKDKIAVVLNKTPFYAEAGGQVGDTGIIEGRNFKITVEDTVYEGPYRVMLGRIKGRIEDPKVYARIDKERRREIERAHTATHMLHAVLRSILGPIARQEGSLVEPGRLRFDFTSPRALKEEEIKKIEEMVYEKIIEDLEIKKYHTTLEKAKKEGVLAFFGEEYGEIVRVVEIPGFSKELCAGTHLRKTGETGDFVIISETAVAAGIRRIEAYVGKRAKEKEIKIRSLLKEIERELGVPYEHVIKKIKEKRIKEEELTREKERLLKEFAKLKREEFIKSLKEVNGINFICGKVSAQSREDTKLLLDSIKEKLSNFLVFLFLEKNKKIEFVLASDKVDAGSMAKRLCKLLGGGGGGSKRLGEGGGISLDKEREICKKLEQLLTEV